jgi:hypothetical protein
MSDADVKAVPVVQKTRICYVAAPLNTDLSTIKELLTERQMHYIVSADLSSTASTFLEGLVNAISDADLFIAILNSNQSNDQIYIELGIAVAKECRILVLASPGVLPTLDIAEIPAIRSDATNRDAISFMLDQVLEAPPRKYGVPLLSSEPQKSQPIGDLADELLAQLDASDKTMKEDEIIYLLAQALRKSVPSTVVESPLLQDRNNPALEYTKSVMRPDLMVWSDEFGPWIGSPLIIEVKRILRGEKDCNDAVQQTLSYLQLSQTRSALIIYASKTSSIANLSSISSPNVFFFDIHELLNTMRTKSFAKVMVDLRNRRVHGIDVL